MAFCGKAEIMEHVLKMQQISLLPKCIQQISLGVLFMCICIQKCRLFKVNVFRYKKL